MHKLGPVLPSVALVLIAISLLACGTSRPLLQSISVTPATANGHVQFAATGTYTNGHTVSPLTALWTIYNPWSSSPSQPIPNGVTVDSTGLGQCTTYAGTVEIFATAPADPRLPLAQMTMMTPQASGSAQLTCP